MSSELSLEINVNYSQYNDQTGALSKEEFALQLYPVIPIIEGTKFCIKTVEPGAMKDYLTSWCWI